MTSLDLTGVDPVRWTEIRARVEVIERFLAIGAPTERDRLTHAAELGLHRTQFMKLVRAWKAHGSAAGIAGAKPLRQKVRIGWRALPEASERLMRETLEAFGPDVKPVTAAAAVTKALAEKGLPLPDRSTVWRRLMTIRQARGSVAGAGDVVVAECRVRLPMLSDRGIVMPSLLMAACTCDGRILTAIMLQEEMADAERLGHMVRNLTSGPVTVDKTYANGVGGPPEARALVSPGVARSTLARVIGRRIGKLELQFNRTTFTADRLLKTKEDRPLEPDDARKVVEDAIGNHNASRGGSTLFGLL